MKAIVYNGGSGKALKLAETEKPVPADDEVLIKVHAASLNPMDYHLLRHPFLRGVISRATKGKITRPGGDASGEVEAVGRNVTQFKPGDEVFGACNGAFAEYACTRESALVCKPPNVSFEQVASVPIAGLTALQGLRDKARIQAGHKVLINGAAGGIGTFAVQFAKTFGADVTGVCSTRNLEMVRSIGADAVIDYTREDFTSSGLPYDVIFDVVSNHSFSDNKRALTPNGVYVGAGALAHHGSMLGILTARMTELLMSPFVSQKFISFIAKLSQNDLSAIGALIAEGKVKPVIDRCYSLSEVPDALRYLEERHARGKVIIKLD